MTTRTRKRITKAVESRGYSVESMEYEAPYYAGEMSGYAGGWTVVLDRPYLPNTSPGDEFFGFSVDEVLAEIDYWLRPTEPCPCDREHNAMQAARLKNDPQRPTHDPTCSFHIAYRLRWWKP